MWTGPSCGNHFRYVQRANEGNDCTSYCRSTDRCPGPQFTIRKADRGRRLGHSVSHPRGPISPVEEAQIIRLRSVRLSKARYPAKVLQRRSPRPLALTQG